LQHSTAGAPLITKLTAKEKMRMSRFIGLLAALMFVVSFPVNGAVAGKKAGAESKSARIEGTTSDRFQRGNIIMSRAWSTASTVTKATGHYQGSQGKFGYTEGR
jgi:hypothetical protein